MKERGLLVLDLERLPGMSLVQWVSDCYENLFKVEWNAFAPSPEHSDFPYGVRNADELLRVRFQCAAHDGKIDL